MREQKKKKEKRENITVSRMYIVIIPTNYLHLYTLTHFN